MKLKVIIPVYKSSPSEAELLALKHNADILKGREIVLLAPQAIDTSAYSSVAPNIEILSVSDDWLGTVNGIAGYNRMTMSETFYRLFDDYDYILILHLDAWLFRDELDMWMTQGYDHIAAPWPSRYIYRNNLARLWFKFKKRLLSKDIIREDMYGRVGNGGLSLRKVEAFAQAAKKYQAAVERYLKSGDPLHNEDIFWAIETPEITTPDQSVAAKFAYDLKPALCHRLNNNCLPMGCHGFNHKSRRRFWQRTAPELPL